MKPLPEKNREEELDPIHKYVSILHASQKDVNMLIDAVAEIQIIIQKMADAGIAKSEYKSLNWWVKLKMVLLGILVVEKEGK